MSKENSYALLGRDWVEGHQLGDIYQNIKMWVPFDPAMTEVSPVELKEQMSIHRVDQSSVVHESKWWYSQAVMTTHYFKKNNSFLVVQWLRTCLPVQGTWVLSLVWEDATSHGQLSLCAETTEPKLLSARNHHQEKPQLEKAWAAKTQCSQNGF